jgi:hypothetical protein
MRGGRAADLARVIGSNTRNALFFCACVGMSLANGIPHFRSKISLPPPPLYSMYLYARACGVVYLMKRSELGLVAWCLGSWWCVLWIRNKLSLSNMPSSTRYNGSTGFGRYSTLGGAGNRKGSAGCVSHLPTRVLAFTTPISDPDFGFGVDPERLRGYPLAHLAGRWRA